MQSRLKTDWKKRKESKTKWEESKDKKQKKLKKQLNL